MLYPLFSVFAGGFLFQGVGDRLAGILLLCLSLFLLCLCLVAIVKLLNSVLKGKIAKLVKKVVNAEFPGKCSYFTGNGILVLFIECLLGTSRLPNISCPLIAKYY